MRTSEALNAILFHVIGTDTEIILGESWFGP